MTTDGPSDVVAPPANAPGVAATFATLRRLISGFVPRAFLLAVASFAGGLAEAGMLVSLTAAADAVVRDVDTVSLAGLEVTPRRCLEAGLVLLALRGALLAISYVSTTATSAAALATTRQRLVHAFLDARSEAQSEERLGALQERITTWCVAVATVAEAVFSLLSSLLLFTALVVVAAAVDLRAVALLMGCGVLMAVGLRPISKWVRRSSEEYAAISYQYAVTVGETTALAPELAAFGVGPAHARQLDAHGDRVTRAWSRTRLAAHTLPNLYQTTALALVFLALLVVAGDSTGSLATWGAVVLLLLRSLSAGLLVVQDRTKIINGAPLVRNVSDEIERLEAAADPPGTVDLQRIGVLVFEGVAFTYGDGHVLSDLSFRLDAGRSLAVIGPSGVGKSTLAGLILRQLNPTGGRITADGTDLVEVTPTSWTRLVTRVPQQAAMLTGTIAENVVFLRDLDDSAVRSACQRANVLDEIEALPLGLDTPIGPRSGPLSVGQRQRVAIARALAGEPDLIVLDEPTSALDVVSERRIAETLQALHGSVSLIVIAHRHSIVEHCDEVLALDVGRVEAYGPPGAVAARSPFFLDMRTQTGPPGAPR